MSDLRKAAEVALEALETLMLEKESIYDHAIQALRQALAQPDDFVYSEDKSYRVSPATGSFGIGDTSAKREWVGLTDENLSVFTTEFYNGVVWAEAKLKEKNGA